MYDKHPNLTENIREWLCPECDALYNRDINIVINNKKFTLMKHKYRNQ
ncbi:hypothetical protein [Methanosarcina barkeri]